MLFGKPNLYPVLEKYLDRNAVEIEWSRPKMTWAVCGGLCLVMSLASFETRSGETGSSHPALQLLWFFAFIALGSWMIAKGIKSTQVHAHPVQIEGLRVRRALRQAKSGGRLIDAMPSSVGIVLEECAVAWKRIDESFAGHVWNDPALPKHWSAIRDTAKSAANDAMDEALALAAPHLLNPWEHRPVRSVSDLIQRVVGGEEPPLTPLPPSFRPAVQIADQLRTLALEVESISQQVAVDSGVRGNLQASVRIDGVLSELRSLQVAEQELHIDP